MVISDIFDKKSILCLSSKFKFVVIILSQQSKNQQA